MRSYRHRACFPSACPAARADRWLCLPGRRRPCAQGLDHVKARLHQVRVPDPDARRRPALHRGLRPQGPVRRPIRSCSLRTPYSVAALRRRRVQVGPRPVAALRQRGLHRRLSGRAGPVDVGGRVRQHAAPPAVEERPAGDRREHRHLRHDRLAAQERPEPQRQGGHVGDLLSRLLHRGRDDRRPPRAQGRLAPGARSPTGSPATTGTTTAPCSCPTPSTSSPSLRPSAARADQEGSTSKPFDYGTPDGYAFYLEMGPLANANKKYFKDDVPFWNEMMQHANYDDFWAARNLRPHLKNIKPAVMTVGGWFDAENLYGALETYKSVEASSPRHDQRPGHGPLAARRLGARRRRLARPRPVPLEHGGLLPRADRVPVLPVLPEGQGHARASPRRGSSRPGPTSGGSTTPGRPARPRPRSLYPPAPRASSSLDRPGPRPTATAFDEYVSDPAQPVEYIDQISRPG